MEAVVSSELDDAIFPQPPQETEQEVNEMTQQISDIDANAAVGSQENWEDEKSEEVCNDAADGQDIDEDDRKSKKKDPLKKKSRLKRLFTGIRLKKNEESETSSTDDDDTGSELTLDSREASNTAMEEGALVNKTAFTRIIHRVQTKANRMWEQIGQKLGGKADSDEDEITEDSSKSLSLNLSEAKEGGDAPDNKKELDSETSMEEGSRVRTEE